MNKQEILTEINKTKEHLANLEKMLAECEYKRWKPKNNKMYYFVNSYRIAESDYWNTKYAVDQTRYNAYNCFKTEEEAKVEAEKILVRRMLEDIARRLNRGKKINWNDKDQGKYYIYWDNKYDSFSYGIATFNRYQGVVYCLNKTFKDIAIQEIGEERLKKYLRGE